MLFYSVVLEQEAVICDLLMFVYIPLFFIIIKSNS